MSNSLALAAATATLRDLISGGIHTRDKNLAGLQVTTMPLDIARKHITAPQLNLFVYQTAINAAWRNMDMPRQVRPGEAGSPPLPLNLHFIITAYGNGDKDDGVDLRVLGAAMSTLHDNAVLERGAIAAALRKNDLADQIESLRVTMHPFGIEDISKLWMAFQSSYRISAAYEVTVTLIDSLTPVRSPLPVLQRGQNDRGVMAIAGTAPNLTGVVTPHSQSAALLGDSIAIKGSQLTTSAVARFTTSRLAAPVDIAPLPDARPGQIAVTLPSKGDTDAMKDWAPGMYTVALVPSSTNLPSNAIAFALAPQVALASNSAGAGTVDVKLTCAPRISDAQIADTKSILLLFGDRQIAPKKVHNPPDQTKPTHLEFDVPDVVTGTYLVRLRVDGVDSIPVTYAGNPPIPSFDPLQQVAVT